MRSPSTSGTAGPATRAAGSLLILATALATALAGCSATSGADRPRGTAGATRTGRDSTSSAAAADDSQDPARYAAHVVRYAREAGVDPQLVLTILYNESYKPHDPQFEDSWAEMDPDASRGVANMHRAAFDDTKRGRPFANRAWEDLTDDPALAIRAQAWFLHDLGRRLPAGRTARLTVEELLALGYNAGAGNMRAFARGTAPGPQARDYLSQFRRNWPVAGGVLGRPASTPAR